MDKLKMFSLLTLLFVLLSALEVSQDRLKNRNAFLMASVLEEENTESLSSQLAESLEPVPEENLESAEALPETPESVEETKEKTETIFNEAAEEVEVEVKADTKTEAKRNAETEKESKTKIKAEAEATAETITDVEEGAEEEESNKKTDTKKESEERKESKTETKVEAEAREASETPKETSIETESSEEIAKKIEADNLNRDLICSDLEGRKELMILGKRIENAVQVTFRVLSPSQCPNLCKEEQFFDLDPEKTDRGKCKKISKGCYDGGSDGIKFNALEACEQFYENQAFQGDFQSRKEEVDLKQEKKKMKEKYQLLKNTCIVEGAVNCDRQKEKHLFQCLKDQIIPCFQWDPFLYGIEDLKSFEALSELGNKILEWRNQTGK